MKLLDFLKNKEWARYILVLVAGIAIGAIFYPTKNIEETIEQKYEHILERTRAEYENRISDLKDVHQTEIRDYSKKNEALQSRFSLLVNENNTLKSKQKTSFYKLVKPDGTVEVKKYTESEIDESNRKVTAIQLEYSKKIQEIESKWEKIHLERVSKINESYKMVSADYERKIQELEKKTVISTNPKKYGIAAGYLTSNSYYMSGEADVFGPVYLQVHGQTGQDNALGAAIGLRF